MKVSRKKIANNFVKIFEDKGLDHAVQVLAAFLIETRQTQSLKPMIYEIEMELRRRGIALAEVMSATKLSAAIIDSIKHYIASDSGLKEVVITEKIDSDLIGGIKLTSGELELDLTFRSDLERLKTYGGRVG